MAGEAQIRKLFFDWDASCCPLATVHRQTLPAAICCSINAAANNAIRKILWIHLEGLSVMDNALFQQLEETSITDLSVGSASLKRGLKKLGVSNIIEAFDLPKPKLDDSSLFSLDELDEFDDLEGQFRENPELFAQTALRVKNVSSETKRLLVANHVTMGRAAKPDTAVHFISRTAGRRHELDPTVRSVLDEAENQIKRVYEEFACSGEPYLAFSIFPELPFSPIVLAEPIEEQFVTWKHGKEELIYLLSKVYPYSFITYTEARVNECYAENALWERFFDSLELSDNAQSAYKRALVDSLKTCGLPVFAESDARCYWYTALLHAGFSEQIWNVLWKSCILPVAKCNGNLESGASILERIAKGGERGNGKVLATIFSKMPLSIAEPLLDSAYLLARRVTKNELQSSFALTDCDLPECALDSLSHVVSGGEGSATHGRKNVPNGHGPKFLRLPKAALCFDSSSGALFISWKSRAFGVEFSGCEAIYAVNGKPCDKPVPLSRTDRGFGVPNYFQLVERSAKYDVEFSLHEANGAIANRNGVVAGSDSIRQFHRGCWEFTNNGSKEWRLRGRAPIKRQTELAFIVDEGLELRHGLGAELLKKITISVDNGANCVAQVLSVNPGCSFELVDANDGIHASWIEGISTSIEGGNQIGTAVGCLDLFGSTGDSEHIANGQNQSLPIIAVSGDDLDELAHLKMCLNWGDGEIDITYIAEKCEGRVIFDLSRVVGGLGLHPFCELICRSGLTEEKILYYSFAVAPVRGPVLERTYRCNGTWFADYRFKAVESIRFATDNTTAILHDGQEVATVEELASDSVSVEFDLVDMEEGQRRCSLNANIFLAGIEVQAKTSLFNMSQDDIFFPMLLDKDPGYGLISFGSQRRSKSAAVYLYIGEKLYCVREFCRAGVQYADVLDRLWAFCPESVDEIKDIPICLAVRFGDEYRDGRLLQYLSEKTEIAIVKASLGIEDVAACMGDGENRSKLVFNRPSPCRLYAEVRRKNSDLVRDYFSINPGESAHEVDDQIVRYASLHKQPLVLTLYPLASQFDDEPDKTYSIDIPIHKLQGEIHG